MLRFGKIKAIKMVQKQNCAFVCFFARESAVGAIEALYDRYFLNNDESKKLKVLWAKSQLELPSAPRHHKKYAHSREEYKAGEHPRHQ
jgi:hypothetical protein